MIKYIMGILLFINIINASETEYVEVDQKDLSKILYFQYIVDNFYVDKLSDMGLEKTFDTILKQIDPHSTFYTQKQFNEFKETLNGDFVGIGIATSIKEGKMTVVSPLEDSPAEKAGIKTKDEIVEINDIDIRGKDYIYIEKLTKDKVGTKIKLKIKRKEEYITKTIIRKKIKIKPVKTQIHKIGSKSILNIKIRTFNNETLEQFQEAIISNNFDALIIDLRNNPGGTLGSTLGISDMFIKKGTPILFEQARKDIKIHKLNLVPTLDKVPTVVLINEGSASASEILSGVLQDYNKATIIGQKSFGKGTVQQIVPLSIQGEEYGAIKLTVARYYLPSKRTIQGLGITPDLKVLEKEEESKEEVEKEKDYKNVLKSKELKIDVIIPDLPKKPETVFLEKMEDRQLKVGLTFLKT